MPLETFHNLSYEKQNKILKSAIKMFAQYGYNETSIQSIADKAGISKGSLYQYFKSKKEMFLYILDLSINAKINYMEDLILKYQKEDFFTLLEKIFLDILIQTKNNPEIYQIYNNMFKVNSTSLKKEIDIKIKEVGFKYYNNLILKGIKKSEIRTDVSKEVIGFTLYFFFKDFGEYMERFIHSVDHKEIDKKVKEFICILKDGLKPKENNN